MQVYFDPRVLQHSPAQELTAGRITPHHEVPARILEVRDALEAAGHELCSPEPAGLEPALAVHDAGMLTFLQNAWQDWVTQNGGEGDLMPISWPSPVMRRQLPASLVGQMGYWCFDASTPICAGTWAASQASLDCAVAGMGAVLGGAGAAFAACRPPGHHAGHDHFGGYGYLNASAAAAQWARDQGVARVAVLDVDDHHGNGTQDIFWRRGDVLTISLHGDPAQGYPFFSGYASEQGAGEGAGANLNLPLAIGAGWSTFAAALERAIDRLRTFAPEVLVLPLGVDTLAGDPISGCVGLDLDDYQRLGAMLAGIDLPTLILMEGGYRLGSIGEAVARTLAGFSSTG